MFLKLFTKAVLKKITASSATKNIPSLSALNALLTMCLLCAVHSTSTAQTGPGGIENSNGKSALSLWLEAKESLYTDTLGKQMAVDGERIRSWKDNSGWNVKTKINVDKKRPTFFSNVPQLNNQPALLFNRANGASNEFNVLHIDSFLPKGDFTIYCVFSARIAGGGTDLPGIKTGASNNSWYYGAGLVDTDVQGITNDMGLALTDTSLAAGEGDLSSLSDYTLKTPVKLNQTTIGAMVVDASHGKMDVFTNGGNLVTTPSSSAARDQVSKISIGATNGNTIYPTNYFDGYIASVLIFSKALNDVEKIILDNYLSAKYATSLATHDYYTMDEPLYGNYDFDVAGIGMAANGNAQISAKGEGIFEMSNPRKLTKDKFFFWGHDSVSPDLMDETDVPLSNTKRLKRTWRTSAINGDLGGVDVKVDLDHVPPGMESWVSLLFDVNNNGKFADDSTGIIRGSKKITGKTYGFSNVTFPDKIRFTVALVPPVFIEEKNLTITPNGDGNNDEYYIKETGLTRIFDRNGQVVKEFNCPCSWNGTNTNGDLVTTGFYVIKFANDQSVGITLIR
jgi:hypothetical protein